MDSAQVIASQSFPIRPSLGEPLHGNDSLIHMEAKAKDVGVEGGGGGATVGVNNVRSRRHKRLADKSRIAPRPSPPTISEHQSLDHPHLLENDKLSFSGDTTATTITAAETPDNSVRVRKVPSTPATPHNNFSSLPESEPLPQSIVTTTRTFPPPEERLSSQLVPSRLKLKNTSRVGAIDSLSSSDRGLGRRRSQSLWDETSGSETKHSKSMQKIPMTPMSSPSLDFDGRKRLPKPRPKVMASRPKPKLQKHSTAPSSTTPSPERETTVVDDALMDRAFIIRQNLMNFEMQELAAEAEKAAESGLEKFVGSTSKFGVEETPPYRPKYLDDGDFVMPSTSSRLTEGFRTPLRSKKSFVDTLTHPMDYTPSYFSRKKIPVTSLRNFSEIVPNFSDMHNNIRIHLGREGVDVNTLPESHSRPLIKNFSDDTEKDDGEDATSQAPTVASQAGSISSFSSYAVTSLASLKDIIEYVHRPRSSHDNMIRPSSSMSNVSHNSTLLPKDLEQSGSLRNAASMDSGNSAVDRKRAINSSLPQMSTQFKPAVASPNSDSDDSSVEFYGRKSPLDLSNQSISSNMSEMNQKRLSMARSWSNATTGGIQQPLLQRRKKSAASVSFETEKANYQMLLDRMHNHTMSTTSFDVDQTSCAPSLTHIDIGMSSSPTDSIKTSSTPMANFLHKISHQFSRASKDGKSPKAIEKDNKDFVSNFFYTNENSIIVDSMGVPSAKQPKLDINPERHRDAYCLPGCGPTDLVSACETATKYTEFVLDWFNVKSDRNQGKNNSTIIDPTAPEQAINQRWIKAWQQSNQLGDSNCQKRLFLPPKLSVRLSVEHHEDAFCSPGSVSLASECQHGAMSCPEVKDPVSSCPGEIPNNIGCAE